MSEGAEGKPTLGSDLTTDHEVKTAAGWVRVKGWDGNIRLLLGERRQELPQNIYVHARLIPKPDPTKERAEKVRAIFEEAGASEDLISWDNVVESVIERIANGEADLPDETAQREIERLTGCLERANAQTEHFEREWYLAKDRIEDLEADLPVPEKPIDEERIERITRQITYWTKADHLLAYNAAQVIVEEGL